MQSKSVTNIRYPESRKRFFLNFALSLWFKKRYEEIIAEGKPERIKRYAQMDPFEMIPEPPIIFYPTKKKFRSCIVDRQAGTLLIDQDIPFVDFKIFLEKSDASEKINQSGNYSPEVAAIIKEGISTENIIALLRQPEKLSKDPIFYLTQENGSDDFIIIYDHFQDDPNFEDLVSWIFRDYTFESIKLELLEPEDDGYPSISSDTKTLSSLYGGKVTLKDRILTEQEIPFNFINLNQLSEIINSQQPTEPTIKNPTAIDKEGNLIDDGSITKDPHPTLSGDGMKPGSTVIIKDNDEEIASVVVGEDGKWVFKPESPLENAEHHFSISGESTEGNSVVGDITITIDVESTDGGGEEGNPSDEDKALADPSEGGKYTAPGEVGFGLTTESTKDISNITKTYVDIPQVTMYFPYVEKGSID